MTKDTELSVAQTIASKDEDKGLRYLVFSLKEEEFAIPLLSVKEVIGMAETTPIPQAPSHFKGVINLRGQIIPIIDLRVKLGLLTNTNAPETSIIILDFDGPCVGMVVDSVNSVVAFEPGELVEATFSESGVKNSCVKEVAKKNDRLILSLDLESMLNVSDRQILSKKNMKQSA